MNKFKPGDRVILKYAKSMVSSSMLEQEGILCSLRGNTWCMIILNPEKLAKRKTFLHRGCGKHDDYTAYFAYESEMEISGSVSNIKEVLIPCKHLYLPSRDKQHQHWCKLCGHRA